MEDNLLKRLSDEADMNLAKAREASAKGDMKAAEKYGARFQVLWDKMELLEKSLSEIDDKASDLSGPGTSMYELYTGEKEAY